MKSCSKDMNDQLYLNNNNNCGVINYYFFRFTHSNFNEKCELVVGQLSNLFGVPYKYLVMPSIN